MRTNINLHQGECIEFMKTLPNNSVDMVLTDPPYGTTACKWDSVIPFEPMWEQLKRVVKDNAAIVLFGSQPFTSALVMSNPKGFHHQWVWEKNIATNFYHAKRMPLRNTEDILVFNKPRYYPIKTTGHPPTQSANGKSSGVLYHGDNIRRYAGGDTTRFPNTILKFDVEDQKNRLHPTQKPIPLLEYLIKTYSLEGETILDFTMGSGSTGVACVNTGRNFIGCELDKGYFDIAEKRIDSAEWEFNLK
jgi:site-specific DNA-methyltransferase (adenine-specific)